MCIYIHTCVCMCVYVRRCVYLYLCIYIYILHILHTYKCVCIYIYIYICVCMCVYIYIYIFTIDVYRALLHVVAVSEVRTRGRTLHTLQCMAEYATHASQQHVGRAQALSCIHGKNLRTWIALRRAPWRVVP